MHAECDQAPDFATAGLMPRPRLLSAILECVILAGSLRSRTNFWCRLHTLAPRDAIESDRRPDHIVMLYSHDGM